MNTRNRTSPRGTVLMASVLLLTLLATLGMAMLSSSLNENTIARNDINAQRALAVAEAGTAHARQVISAAISTTSLDVRLSGATTTNPWRTLYIMPPSTDPLTNYAALGTGNGTYSVQVSNNLAGYKGNLYPAETLPTADVDKLLWIESVGTYGNASRTVRVLVNFVNVVDPPAAITLVDGANPTQLTAGFTGNSFLIQGGDSTPPDTTGACGSQGAAKHGISTNSLSSNNVIANALSEQQEDNIEGQGFIAGAKGSDPRGSYTNNGTYTRGQLQALATSLLSQATPIPAGNNSSDFGTAANPGIFKATSDVTLLGNGKGFGILVVTEDLQMQGNFKWEGLILVVGKGSFHVTGSDSIAYGAVLVANTEQSGTTSLEVAGNGGVYYSSQAICRVKNMMPSSSVIAWQQRW
ncbi:MAG: hypothetical protein HY712_07805 [candidate division NC10 bacterium]|nr:hypothetical protein [candidate division NC10 bacterium]